MNRFHDRIREKVKNTTCVCPVFSHVSQLPHRCKIFCKLQSPAPFFVPLGLRFSYSLA